MVLSAWMTLDIECFSQTIGHFSFSISSEYFLYVFNFVTDSQLLVHHSKIERDLGFCLANDQDSENFVKDKSTVESASQRHLIIKIINLLMYYTVFFKILFIFRFLDYKNLFLRITFRIISRKNIGCVSRVYYLLLFTGCKFQK